MEPATFAPSRIAGHAAADERAAFIRRTYGHLAAAVLTGTAFITRKDFSFLRVDVLLHLDAVHAARLRLAWPIRRADRPRRGDEAPRGRTPVELGPPTHREAGPLLQRLPFTIPIGASESRARRTRNRRRILEVFEHAAQRATQLSKWRRGVHEQLIQRLARIELDRFVIEDLPGEDPQELKGFFADASCFFGECILQEIGGRWSYMGQPAILLASPAGEIIIVLPRARVERAFEEGVSYSLLALLDEFVAQRRSR